MVEVLAVQHRKQQVEEFIWLRFWLFSTGSSKLFSIAEPLVGQLINPGSNP